MSTTAKEIQKAKEKKNPPKQNPFFRRTPHPNVFSPNLLLFLSFKNVCIHLVCSKNTELASLPSQHQCMRLYRWPSTATTLHLSAFT